MSHKRAFELVKQLDHPRAEVRKQAADELVAFGEDAEPALSELLKRTQDIKVRRRALLVLGALRAPKALPGLMDYVLDRPLLSADDTRSLAMRAIVHSVLPRHRKHCFDFFVQMRRDGDFMVRMLAVEGLAKLGDARAVAFLEEVSRADDEEMVRDTARRVLSTFKVIRLEPTEDGTIYSTEELVYKLASRDAIQREMGVAELLKREQAFELFVDAAASPHGLARKSGLIGLGELGDDRAFEILLRVANRADADADERSLALRALSKLPFPARLDAGTVLESLRGHIEQRDDVFRLAAALGVVARLEHPRAMPMVCRHLDASEPWIRESAAAALAEAAGPAHTELLSLVQEALNHSGARAAEVHERSGQWPEDEVVLQRSLLQAATRIAEPGRGAALEMVPVVAKFLAHPREEVRAQAAAFFGKLAAAPGDLGPVELRAVLEQLGSRQSAVQLAALEILGRVLVPGDGLAAPRLASLMYEKDVEVLRCAIPLLARTGDADAEQALARLANDPRERVAEAARRALLDMAGSTAGRTPQ